MITPVVYLVDDDSHVRSAISGAIRNHGYNVKSFNSAEAFLDQKIEIYSCLVLDVRMPGMTGFQLQQRLSSLSVSPPIIFLTGYADVTLAVSAMKLGAVDLLTKPVRTEDLIAAVQHALSISFTKAELNKRLKDHLANLESLTPREREVFDLIILGLLNKQVAFKLGTTERTIKAHRKKVMLKMGATTVQQLMGIAVKLNLLN